MRMDAPRVRRDQDIRSGFRVGICYADASQGAHTEVRELFVANGFHDRRSLKSVQSEPPAEPAAWEGP